MIKFKQRPGAQSFLIQAFSETPSHHYIHCLESPLLYRHTQTDEHVTTPSVHLIVNKHSCKHQPAKKNGWINIKACIKWCSWVCYTESSLHEESHIRWEPIVRHVTVWGSRDAEVRSCDTLSEHTGNTCTVLQNLTRSLHRQHFNTSHLCGCSNKSIT